MTRDQFCSTCGGSVRAIPPARGVERLRGWFVFGDRNRGERFECENGHGWTSGSYLYYSGPGRPSFRGAVRSISGNRTVEPVPATYAMAAGAGLLVGLSTRWLFGWSWWLPVFIAPALAWVASAATAFTGQNRARTVFDLRNRIDPAGAAERHRQKQREELAAISFTVFGLADTDAPVSLGGWGGTSDGKPHEVTMTYGDARDEAAPVIDVSTLSRREPLGYLQEEEEYGLRVDAAGPSHLETSDRSVYDIELAWSEISVTIDGSVRTGLVAQLRGCWSVIIDDVADGSVIVRGRNNDVPRPLTLTPTEVQESLL